ncbi:unnamed protein product [Pleuronectes platessa]|uniref:Uncharacterized protein n=1 Tax=Pleuronectes platessa TaxID=8262 RepID=A0A9N7Y3M0_PLEPL|nr:unnamed protein product [Pleuronectes platessa]
MAADVDTVKRALELLVNLGQVLLQEAQHDAAASLETFVPRKISTLFGLITAGLDFYRSLGVKKRSEAEAFGRSFIMGMAPPCVDASSSYCFCSHAEVREQVEELLQLESEWDSFLQGVDRDLHTTDRQLSGVKSPDNHVAELEAREADLEARSLRVLVVSFGVAEGARLWLQQTGCNFDMMLDPEREVYRSFGLGSSYAKVMKFGYLLQVSEYRAVDMDMPDIPPRLLEDLYQMGGDFLLDEAGLVILSHPSKEPHGPADGGGHPAGGGRGRVLVRLRVGTSVRVLEAVRPGTQSRVNTSLTPQSESSSSSHVNDVTSRSHDIMKRRGR